MNFLNLLFFAIFNLVVSCIAYQSMGYTTIQSSLFRMLSRKKRSILLPKSGSAKLSIGLTKALIANSPKGLSLSWDINKYYAGPSSLDDWLNTREYHNLHNPQYKSANKDNMFKSKTNSTAYPRGFPKPRRSVLQETFKYLLGDNLQYNIISSICKSEHFMLPPGYSMIQDIVRTVFLYRPQGGTFDDGHVCGKRMYCESNCNNKYSFNFLDWILNPMKIS